jgi:hypothetical protein
MARWLLFCRHLVATHPSQFKFIVGELASVAALLISALATASVYDDAHIHHSQGAPGKSDFASSASAAKTPAKSPANSRQPVRTSRCCAVVLGNGFAAVPIPEMK